MFNHGLIRMLLLESKIIGGKTLTLSGFEFVDDAKQGQFGWCIKCP